MIFLNSNAQFPGQNNLQAIWGDFLGGSVVKNLPSNTGDTGSISGQGTKVPSTVEQLSPCTTSTEPTPQLERSPCNSTRFHMPQLRPDAAKSMKKFFFKKKENYF